MTTKNLLVELFVEELPPKALKKLGDAFATQFSDQIRALGLINGDSVTTAYASPRRLAAHISHVYLKAADKAVQQKLMPVSVGLDANGNATKAGVLNASCSRFRRCSRNQRCTMFGCRP